MVEETEKKEEKRENEIGGVKDEPAGSVLVVTN